MLDIALAILIISIANILCFYFGAKIGQQSARGDEIKSPIPSPSKIFKNIEDTKEQKRLQKINEVVLHNIDVYDGTGVGQREIPKKDI